MGGKRRIGYKGTACSDLDGVPWSVECTRTKKGVAAVRAKWAQAVTNARLEGQEPVLVIALPKQPLLEAFVGMRFGLFQQLALAASGHPAPNIREEVGDHEEVDPDPEDDAEAGSAGAVHSVHRTPVPGGGDPAVDSVEDDGVTASYLACMNELRERNEDLAHWRPRVEALVAALREIAAGKTPAPHEQLAADALAEWEKP